MRQEIASDVAERLFPALAGNQDNRLRSGDTTNTEAYQFFLRGRYFWNKRTADGIRNAIREFQQAVEKDPNYALAYVGLANSYVSLGMYAIVPTSEALPKARTAVDRALQIDDSLAEAHASLGQIARDSWNYAEAEREYKRAIELNPNYATAHHFYGLYLRGWRGRVDEAMAEIRLAQQLDPLSPIIGSHVAATSMSKGHLDAAIEAGMKVIELDADFPEAHRILCVVYRKQGRYEQSIAEGEKAVALSGREGWYLEVLGVSYAMAGNRERAREILKELEEKYAKHEARGQQIADIYAVLGQKEQAFAWLEKDVQGRSGALPTIAYDPATYTLRDKLSSDPRWNDLLRRMGLPPNEGQSPRTN